VKERKERKRKEQTSSKPGDDGAALVATLTSLGLSADQPNFPVTPVHPSKGFARGQWFVIMPWNVVRPAFS
jgi:hypothetical protein